MERGTLFYFVFILLLLCGCSQDEDVLGDGPINRDGSIAFCTDSVLSRGTAHDDLKAYATVSLLAYDHGGAYGEGHSLYRQVVLNKDGNTPPTWDYSPRMFWPEGRGLSFLAHASDMVYATASGREGVFVSGNPVNGAPTIEYIVPRDVTRQPDLLVTALLDHPKASNVVLPMKHALACVSFCATGLPGMSIDSIQVKNVYRKGTLVLDDASIVWKPDLGSKALTALNPGIETDDPLAENPTENNYLMTTDGYLMMIPQVLTDASIDVYYRKRADGTKTKLTYSLPSTVAWEPGKRYIYKFGEATDEIVVYYEKYADGSYGFHSNDYRHVDLTPKLKEAEEIIEAGYGVLAKSRLVSSDTPMIRLGSDPAIRSKKVVGASGDYTLYAINQTGVAGSSTFNLPNVITPVPLYFDGNSVESYKIIPHVAKGASLYGLTEYSIRTPQQMKNLSALTTADPFYAGTSGKTFRQERDLDFSKTTIGGGALSGAVVDDHFGGTYEGKYNGEAKSILNVTISAPATEYVGLFSHSASAINDITLKSSSITGGNYVGAISGRNYGMNGAINRPRVIGTDNGAGKMTIKGGSNVGGIAGINDAVITGNPELVATTEITVAEVSGWVDIAGTAGNVGGIAGNNSNKIDKVLVNGVNVESSTDAKITIRGTDQVGGIAGINWSVIDGNLTGEGANVKNMPDLAGIVEISGGNWIGGIVGMNGGGARLNSVNIRLGRVTPMKITGSGLHVGGIAGQNNGTLGVDGSKTFISTRGNIEIRGGGNVGGIVGTNEAGATLQNCFVYNFFTQGSGKKYYAPQIICSGANAGGIVGDNRGAISGSCVFTADQNTLLTISARQNAGGIVGQNEDYSTTKHCSVVGKVLVTVPIPADQNNMPWTVSLNAGGICGINKVGTTISECWIGNSDGYNIIRDAQANMGLVITPPDEPGVQASYGIPAITGKKYIGGIVGLNDGGIIENITLADNVLIGAADGIPNVNMGSDWVGGIAGGNAPSYQGTTNVIRNCTVSNVAGKKVVIQGASNLGGVVGLNNGVIDNCEVSGIAGNPLTITGLGTMGGIAGQVGGHSSIISTEEGNDYTLIKNCRVSGYVTIAGNTGSWGLAIQAGGAVGLLGPTTGGRYNLSGCVVRGTAAGSISVTCGGTTGGVVGKNSGNILSCDVYNTAVTSVNAVAGGITAHSFCNSAHPATAPAYHADVSDCRVYSATISGPIRGTWIGLLDTGALTGPVTIGRTGPNYVFGTPAVGKLTSYGSVTTNCIVQTPPARP